MEAQQNGKNSVNGLNGVNGVNGINGINGVNGVDVDDPIPSAPAFSTMNGAPVLQPAASQNRHVVHARGTSARGFFEVTDKIDDLTSAAFLNQVGKQTKLFCRLSTVAGRADSAETVRDTRGFAFKMYTDEGNLDWLFLSTPVFPIRDGAKFPSFTHATKKNPRSGLPDHKAFWDYFTLNREAIHFLMFLFSDRATPVDFQHADCFSINTYKFTQPGGRFTYVKIHVKTSQGVQNFTASEAQMKAGMDPDFHTRSLYDDIERGAFPQWDVFAQVIDPKVAAGYGIDIFDPTKTFPIGESPLRKFGRIVLNENVDNFFAEQEQSAFSPTNLVPGWALSPDPILQTRALAYADTQRYRLGTNLIQTPVNKPRNTAFNPIVRDGSCNVEGNLAGFPNYFPSSFYQVSLAPQYAQFDQEQFSGSVVDFESPVIDDDYAQARVFWEKTLPTEPGTNQQQNFVSNVAGHLSAVTGDRGEEIRNRVYAMFAKVSQDLSDRIKTATEALVMQNMKASPGAVTNKLANMKLAAINGTNGHLVTHNADMFGNKDRVVAM